MWTGCDKTGLVAVWNTRTFEHKTCNIASNEGFTDMICVDSKVSGALKGQVYTSLYKRKQFKFHLLDDVNCGSDLYDEFNSDEINEYASR